MTFGYSRDDVGKFLPTYLSKGILQNDPFEVILLLIKLLISNSQLGYKYMTAHLRQLHILFYIFLLIKILSALRLSHLANPCLPERMYLQVFDQKGVGELVKVAVERGRKARPDLEV